MRIERERERERERDLGGTSKTPVRPESAYPKEISLPNTWMPEY